MPSELDGAMLATVAENGVARAGFKRSPGVIAAPDGFHVTVFGAAFGNHEIVRAVDFVKMWAFGKFAAEGCCDNARLGQQNAGIGIDFTLHNAARCKRCEIDFAVIIEKERGVKGHRFGGSFYPDGRTPFARRVVRFDDKVSLGKYVGADDIKPAVVMADGGGKNAAQTGGCGKVKVSRITDGMSNLLPVNKV